MAPGRIPSLRREGDRVGFFYMLWGFVAAAVGGCACLAGLAGWYRHRK